MVYQEQVMQIARTLAGYSLGGADLLRRAMGKKIARGDGGSSARSSPKARSKNGIEPGQGRPRSST